MPSMSANCSQQRLWTGAILTKTQLKPQTPTWISCSEDNTLREGHHSPVPILEIPLTANRLMTLRARRLVNWLTNSELVNWQDGTFIHDYKNSFMVDAVLLQGLTQKHIYKQIFLKTNDSP